MTAALTARRALMGVGHLSRSAHAAEPHPDGEHLSALDEHAAHDDYTMDVRVIAIFAIAVAAMLCGLPPLFMRAFQSPDTTVARIARAFSGGIILALALVHIIPEAVMELSEVVDFPIGGVTVLFGILALVVIDSTLTALWAPEDYKEDLRAGRSGGRGAESTTVIKPLGTHCHSHAAPPKDAAAREVTLAEDAAANPSAHTHTHACTSALTAQRWIGSAGAPLSNVKQRVTAYTMELGCIFHSVIIGVGVGVITGDRQLVIVLMIALIVHQGLEGLSLGTVLALTRFPMAKKVAMVLVYSITTSVGIAIGIAVSKGYDPESVVSKAVQGTLNGVSGGMLIYISMYQLIAEEFSREDLVVKGRLRAGMIAGLLLGAACMIILAIWS